MAIHNIWRLFECYSYEQIQEKISFGIQYLEDGSENLPIDFSGSITFLHNLEELFRSFVQTPVKQEITNRGVSLCLKPLFEDKLENTFYDIAHGLKFLVTEMRMVLTLDNMAHFLYLNEFLDSFLSILEN